MEVEKEESEVLNSKNKYNFDDNKYDCYCEKRDLLKKKKDNLKKQEEASYDEDELNNKRKEILSGKNAKFRLSRWANHRKTGQTRQ